MKTIGVVGGGQLCLMMGEDIKKHGLPITLISLDPNPQCPAHTVTSTQLVGEFSDEERIKELADKSDVVTFEIELAGSKALSQVDTPVYPSPAVLKIIQDKFIQADYLAKQNIAVPRSIAVGNKEELNSAIEELGLPVMIKARKDSYDGKGNAILRQEQDVDNVLAQFGNTPIMAQKFVHFEKEVSVMCARSVNGDIVTFPTAENVHGKEYNILHTTLVPAQISPELDKQAQSLAKDCVQTLNSVGVFGVELLVTKNEVLVNEIAPRVHNSGHYSIEACNISQFTQHLRAVSADTLTQPELIVDNVIMFNIIGQQNGPYELLFKENEVTGTQEVEQGVFVHNYGKQESRTQRKMGHLTILGLKGETSKELIARAQQLYESITIKMK